PATALGGLLPQPTDVLAQTYVLDQGRLYSRYAPGFPILLAGWTALFGGAAAHVLNPIVLLLLLVVVIALGWRLFRSPWRGTALAVLLLVCPTGASLWALTPTRDLAAHLCAFVALALLAGRGVLRVPQVLVAGLALGYAASIRPDTVLYLVPASVLAGGRWWSHREWPAFGRLAAAGVLGVALGLAPSLAYYWAATGNPFVPTQSMEVAGFFGGPETPAADEVPDAHVGYPPAAWRGTTGSAVSGGGLKLEYLWTTLPGNWAKIQTAYGPVLLAIAGWGLVVALILRPAFGLAAASYVVVALFLFSCWARPYGRYLVGIWLLVPALLVEGTFGSLDLVRRLHGRGGSATARGLAAVLAVALVVGHLLFGPREDATTALLPVTRLLALGGAAALAAAAIRPERRIAMVAVPVLVLGLVALGCGRLWATTGSRATFQRPQAAAAASIVRRTLASPAVVITSEDIGRPLENLEYYADVRAIYLTDLERWNIPIWRAMFELLVSETEPYLLIPRSLPQRDRILSTLRGRVQLDLVQEIPPERNFDYFATAGVTLELWHVR
ncbi:MAG TPA: hypothetical protein VKA21_04520, partial [Candidatus Binatia bacterium]|nr:hypothetical protein [Candidatus Binatia bacterium]